MSLDVILDENLLVVELKGLVSLEPHALFNGGFCQKRLHDVEAGKLLGVRLDGGAVLAISLKLAPSNVEMHFGLRDRVDGRGWVHHGAVLHICDVTNFEAL